VIFDYQLLKKKVISKPLISSNRLMKTAKLIFSYFVASLFFLACSKSNNSSNNATPVDLTKAIASAQYDKSNFGLYKGVFVGSSGIVIISVNNDNTLSALLKVDGTNYTFTSSQTFQPNTASVINFVNGNNSFTFSIAADGSNPTVTNLIFSGHPNAAIAIVKQTSTVSVDLYQGTYTSPLESGTFNFVIAAGKIVGTGIDTQGLDKHTIAGMVSGNTVSGTITQNATFSGTITGNTISGTIVSPDTKGTFQVVKTQ
jgi:hypothetical protein